MKRLLIISCSKIVKKINKIKTKTLADSEFSELMYMWANIDFQLCHYQYVCKQRPDKAARSTAIYSETVNNRVLQWASMQNCALSNGKLKVSGWVCTPRLRQTRRLQTQVLFYTPILKYFKTQSDILLACLVVKIHLIPSQFVHRTTLQRKQKEHTAFSGFTPNINQPVNTFLSSVIIQNTEQWFTDKDAGF